MKDNHLAGLLCRRNALSYRPVSVVAVPLVLKAAYLPMFTGRSTLATPLHLGPHIARHVAR